MIDPQKRPLIPELDENYAIRPIPGAEAQSPRETIDTATGADFYIRGANQLDTLPANWWNFLWQRILQAGRRQGLRVADMEASLDAIMTEAGQIYTDQDSDLMTALTVLWRRDTDALVSSGQSVLEQALSNGQVALEEAISNGQAALQAMWDSGVIGAIDALEARVASLEQGEIEARIIALEVWRAALASSNFNITGLWTCPTPAIEESVASGQSILGAVSDSEEIQAQKDQVTALELWRSGLAASDFDITGVWTCPMPTLEEAIETRIRSLEVWRSAIGEAMPNGQSSMEELETRALSLEEWCNGLAASNFDITNRWTCPTPALPSF